MTQEQELRIGDKVRYKADEFTACQYNGHVFGKVYTIKSFGGHENRSAYFKESDSECGIYRLELVEAAKKQHPLADILRAIADGEEIVYRPKGTTNAFKHLQIDDSLVNVSDKNDYRLKSEMTSVKKYNVAYLNDLNVVAKISDCKYRSVEEFVELNPVYSKKDGFKAEIIEITEEEFFESTT